MTRSVLSALTAIILITSCAGLIETVDQAGDRGEALITHTTEEIGKLKTETLAEVSQLKTETLTEVKSTIEEITPKLIESVLNTDAVAFLIVATTSLLGVVVIVSLVLLLGAARALFKRWTGY